MYKKYGKAPLNEDTAVKNSRFILQLEQSLLEVESNRSKLRQGNWNQTEHIFFDILLY